MAAEGTTATDIWAGQRARFKTVTVTVVMTNRRELLAELTTRVPGDVYYQVVSSRAGVSRAWKDFAPDFAPEATSLIRHAWHSALLNS
eukprot:1524540-Rhodomonas_salina.1